MEELKELFGPAFGPAPPPPGHSFAECELEALQSQRERIEQLERDKETLLGSYTEMTPEAF